MFSFTEYKSIDIWLRYKDFSDFPNSKIIAGMLKVQLVIVACLIVVPIQFLPFGMCDYSDNPGTFLSESEYEN